MILYFYWLQIIKSTKNHKENCDAIYLKANQVIEISMVASKELKKFVIFQKIADGNNSEVYECMEIMERNCYVLKFSRFVRGTASFYLQNPSEYIVKYYGFGCIYINSQKYWVDILELGIFTLENYIMTISLIRIEILIIIKQILDGLRFCHFKNNVYGNLSLHKFVLTDSYKVKFLGNDLHLLNKDSVKNYDCKKNEQERTDGLDKAPEIRNGSSYTCKTDIWYLGSLIYYIYTKTRYLGYIDSNSLDNETTDFISFFLKEDPSSRPNIDFLFLNNYFDEIFKFLDIFNKIQDFTWEINSFLIISKKDNLITVEKNEFKFFILEIIPDKLSSCDGLIRLFLYYYSKNVDFYRGLSKSYNFSRYIYFFVGFDLDSLYSVTQLDFTAIKILEHIVNIILSHLYAGEIFMLKDFDLTYIKMFLNYYPA
ncbi:hypothetical protein CWI37_0105p0070 [Hamiltosporidium tvaerminnensis]|uniref:Protein kinase domain-containing protein n=2 Tax=Hamiltosporidium tvaerminnensis TaxID=1176355 RepID=A0A4Q9LC68_9MICR|nr:hypothetical protein CWI37_0105p0070 [Hamiltosporidium tvaerminnensis]